MLVADMAERRRDAVEERLGADEAVIGQQIGAEGEMLAGAEADLEMQRPVIPREPRLRSFSAGSASPSKEESPLWMSG